MEKSFNITELFLAAAAQYPDKLAIIEQDRVISYRQLEADVRYTAAYFEKRGIVRGDRVLVFVPMGIPLYRIVLALFYMGATAVFLDEWSDRKRLDTCCKVADCKAFIGHWKAHLLRLLSAGIRRIPIKLSLGYSKERMAPHVATHMQDAALITLTTGSTAAPKAAVRTHGFLLEQFRALEEKISAHPTDVDMSVLPIVLLINLAVGSTSVIAAFKPSKPTQMDARLIVRQLLDHQVTRIVASPYFIKRLAQHILSQNIQIPHLDTIFTGGAPVFQREALLFTQAFPHQQVQVVYGSTEAEPISSIEATALAAEHIIYQPHQGLAVGIPYHKTAVRIIHITEDKLFDISGQYFDQITCSEGQWGEIVVSGPHVLAHYYKNEAAMKANKIFIDGVYWHRTGDSGYLQDGHLFLTGRCQTLIPQQGAWISPFVFENYVLSIQGVEIGTILHIDGALVAFIECSTGATDFERIRARVLSLPLTITKVKFCNLPRDSRHHSKIDYHRLRKAGSS